jgi:hypothetical protein
LAVKIHSDAKFDDIPAHSFHPLPCGVTVFSVAADILPSKGVLFDKVLNWNFYLTT